MTRPSSRRQRGVAMIELAFLLPVLVLIAFGITELGRAMYQYDTLAKSARAAARYLAVFPSDDAQVRSEAKCVAVYGNPGCTGNPLLPGLTTAMVDVQVPSLNPALVNIQSGSGAFDLVAVTLSPAAGNSLEPYPFRSLMPFVIPDIAFGPISVAMPQSFH